MAIPICSSSRSSRCHHEAGFWVRALNTSVELDLRDVTIHTVTDNLTSTRDSSLAYGIDSSLRTTCAALTAHDMVNITRFLSLENRVTATLAELRGVLYICLQQASQLPRHPRCHSFEPWEEVEGLLAMSSASSSAVETHW